jgi:hypothetical protein
MAPPFLTSALRGGKWAASRPGHFTPGETAPGTHCIGGWVGPRVCLNITENRIFLASAGNRIPVVHFLLTENETDNASDDVHTYVIEHAGHLH